MILFYYYLELGGVFGKGNKWSEWKVDVFLWVIGIFMSVIIFVILYF